MSDPKENTQNTEETVPSEEIKEEEAAPAPEEEAPEAPAEEPAEDEAEKLRKDMAAEKERYLRLAAEYDNFRKRSARERDSIYADVKADTIVKLLPVFDNLQRALENPTADEAYRKGVEMTLNQFLDVLKAWALHPSKRSGRRSIPRCTTRSCTRRTPNAASRRSFGNFRKASKWGIA